MAYTPEQKAQAIVVAAFSSDREAAEELDVSRRSIQRWRADMESDPELAENVATLYRDEIESADWLEDATRTVQTAFSFLRQAANQLDPADPDAVLAVSRAIQTITEAKLAADVINARLAEQSPKSGEEGREDVAGYIGTG